MRFHRQRQGTGLIIVRENLKLVERVIAAKAVEHYRQEREKRQPL